MATAFVNWLSNFPAAEVGTGIATTALQTVAVTYNVTTNYVIPTVTTIATDYVVPAAIATGNATFNAVTYIVKGKAPKPNYEALDLETEYNAAIDFIEVDYPPLELDNVESSVDQAELTHALSTNDMRTPTRSASVPF